MFVCDFHAEHFFAGEDPASVKVEKAEKPSQFTISIPESCDWKEPAEGSYINVGGAWGGMGAVYCSGGRITFVEKTYSDNAFILSIFGTDKSAQSYPAVWSTHIWAQGIGSLGMPSIRFGTCRSWGR